MGQWRPAVESFEDRQVDVGYDYQPCAEYDVYGLYMAYVRRFEYFFDFGVQPTKIMGEPTYGGVFGSGGQRVKIIVPKQFYGVILRARWCPHS